MSWPRLRGQLGHRRRVEDGPAARQLDHAAVVVAVHDRLDAGARRVRARVDVRDQADRPGAPSTVAGSVADDVAVVVQRGVLEARSRAARRRAAAPARAGPGVLGLCVRVARGLRVDADVAQEALEQVGSERLGQRRREGGGAGGHDRRTLVRARSAEQVAGPKARRPTGSAATGSPSSVTAAVRGSTRTVAAPRRCAPCRRRRRRGSPRRAARRASSAARRPCAAPARKASERRAGAAPSAPTCRRHARRLAEHRRRVGVARRAPRRDAHLDHELGPDAEVLGRPQHGVGQAARPAARRRAREAVRRSPG